jgi:membrane-associated phospholipid phosphatase
MGDPEESARPELDPRSGVVTRSAQRSRRLLLAAVVAIGFLLVGVIADGGATEAVDVAAVAALASIHGSPLDLVMRLITRLGDGAGLAVFTGGLATLLVTERRYRSAVYVFLTFVAAEWASVIFKNVFLRPRPFESPPVVPDLDPLVSSAVVVILGLILLIVLRPWRNPLALLIVPITAFASLFGSDFAAAAAAIRIDSYPSGHALRTAALAASLFLVLPGPRGATARVIAIAVVALIGFSRVYLSDHFPTDVLGGWLGGTAVALLLGALLVEPSREHELSLGEPITNLTEDEREAPSA